MGSGEQRYKRSQLNTSQIQLLEVVYKYRFVSRKLLAESLDITYGSSLFDRLEVLVKYGYIAKRVDTHLKLQGVPTAYYLTPLGLRTLQAIPGHDYVIDMAIKAAYGDSRRSMGFVVHTIDVHRYTNILKRQYSSLKVFTRRELGRYSYIPNLTPDSLLSLPVSGSETPKRYFLDLIADTQPRPVTESRLVAYLQFFDDGGWDVLNSPLPIVLLICESPAGERRLRRFIRSAVSKTDYDELEFYTTTSTALKGIDSEGLVWTDVDDVDELLELSQLT